MFNTKRSILIAVLMVMLVMAGMGIAEAAQHDFGGETVTLYGYNVTEDMFAGAEAQAHLEQVEADFNVNVEFQEYGYHEVPDILREEVIAGEADGIWRLWYDQAIELALEGFLMNLEVFETHDNYFMTNSLDPEIEVIDGTQYMFNTTYEDQWGIVNPEMSWWSSGFSGVYYNKDMLDDFGLEDLNDIYQAGEWTYDTFEHYLSELTRDTTGDGEIDQYGMIPTWGHFSPDFLLTNDVEVVRDVDGRKEFALDEPEAIEALEFMYNIYDSGYIEPDHWGWPHDPWAEELGAMMIVHLWSFSEVMEDIEFEAGFVPLPRGPNAEQHIAPVGEIMTAVIPPTREEDDQALIDLHTALFRDSEEYVSFEEVEEGIYDNLGAFAQTREMLENLVWAEQNLVPHIYDHDLLGADTTWEIIDPILQGEPAASHIDSMKPAIQSHLDDIFN